MFTMIKEFFLKRTYNKIKDISIKGAIEKLEILAKLKPTVNVSTYEKDRIIVEMYCSNIEELPMMLLSIKDDIEQSRSLYIPVKYQTLKGGTITEWCLNEEDEYLSLLEMAPIILNALKQVQDKLNKNNDTFYVDYVNRKSIYFTRDTDQFITALKTIHY